MKTVMEALRGADRKLWAAALSYLVAHPEDPLCAQIPERVWEEVLGLPMAWVPPGPFWMGSDKAKDPQAYDDELPQHQVALPGYWIGRYLVTVAQWRAFLEASNYEPRDESSLLGQDDHPVVKVTWYDALAYCRWLSEKAGLPVTLPSEAEWEKAARGTNGRIYPWGNEWDQRKLNNWGTGPGSTTPVGQYSPDGDSPYGLADMAGNVWEWCRSLYRHYPYDPKDGREDPKAEDRRVVRGGAFFNGQGSVRCTYRYRYISNFGNLGLGFRIVIAPHFAPLVAHSALVVEME